jgi:hypothetical protein
MSKYQIPPYFGHHSCAQGYARAVAMGHVTAVRVLGLASLLPGAASHGAVVYPPPRNAIDHGQMPWGGPVPRKPPGVESATGWCPVWSEREGKVTGQNGQSCFWFSNGCAIGCERCDGSSRGPLPSSRDPHWRGCGQRVAGGTSTSPLIKCNLCPEANATATICDPKLRTINSQAVCGGADDYYYYSPWRAPYAAGRLQRATTCGVAFPLHGISLCARPAAQYP